MMSFLYVAMQFAIVWTNTTVVIPLGDSLEPYKAMPQAQLLDNNLMIEDDLMYYERGAMYTSFSVINTNRVKDYTIKYNVYFPTYGMKSQQDIKFSVRDLIAPTIIIDNDLNIQVGSKIPDLKEYLNILDNYDDLSNLTLKIDTTMVNMNIVGRYEVPIKVIDKSNNQSTDILIINVIDKQAPIIKQTGEIRWSLNQKGDYFKYFSVTDNYDQVFIKSIDDSMVNYSLPGTYTIRVTAIDQSNNISSLYADVIIIDNQAPKLILSQNELIFSYQEIIDDEKLRSFIFEVSDDYDKIDKDIVKIQSTVNTNFLGTYQVSYEITDQNNNRTIKQIITKVVDNTKPIINITKPTIIIVNDIEPDIYDYIEIEDNYDSKDDLKLTIKNKVDTSKVGVYRLELSLKDTSGNEKNERITFTVIDNVAPTIKVNGDVTITDYQKPNYMDYIKITDNYEKNVEVEILDKAIDYQQVGIYTLGVKATDSFGNETIENITLNIVDITSPEIILTTFETYLSYEVVNIDLLSYIETVSDDNDKTLSINNVTFENRIKYGVIGRHEVIFNVKDKSGNQTSQKLIVILGDYVGPEIKITPFTIKKNNPFHYKEFVTAYDNYDGDLTSSISYGPSYIPTNIPGSYEVIFYVHDSSGNYTEQKIVIDVIEEDNLMDYVIYVGGVVLIIGVLSIYYFYSKRKVKF